MKYLLIFVLLILSIGVMMYVIQQKNNPPNNLQPLTSISMNTLVLTSSAFTEGEMIPQTYTCDGNNINPPLSIAHIPAEAQSLVLIMDDPDAPRGTWDHWVKFNIPPVTRVIVENSEPEGVSGIGSGGKNTYQGPCPSVGEHRYFFKLYALDTRLTLPEGATKKEIESVMQGHILADGHLMGRYARTK